ncbi:hypothetical protein I546_1144 [Mycobacterium kansasii 732]|nr:hypothetical protein I546_1144 [Mycobacterium kansasii 732]
MTTTQMTNRRQGVKVPSDRFESEGSAVMNAVRAWYERFIAVTDDDDLDILTLWTVHTHLVRELVTTPRLLIDSVVPGSGKTTVLDHFNRLCHHPIQAALLSSSALLPRLLESDMRTVLLDEVDRSLRPDKSDVQDLIAVLNSGYRLGATRPVLVQVDGQWEAQEMSTFAPVAMAGNSPHLPPDTLSRSIRILLMPDLHGCIEDSDWELWEDDAAELHKSIVEWTGSVSERIRETAVDLPERCIGRLREKWRPMKRIAVLAGGRWPAVVDALIEKSIAEDDLEREAGLKALPPGMVLLKDLYDAWPNDDDFLSSKEIVDLLIEHNPDFWDAGSGYGRAINAQRLGRMLNQAAKIHSVRERRNGPRGFKRTQFQLAWDSTRYRPGGVTRTTRSTRRSRSTILLIRVLRLIRVFRVH